MAREPETRGAGDLWGGFAAMLVALPSAIGYGVTVFAGLGPEYAARGALAGLLGAVALGCIAPLLGGTPRLVSAPCGPAAVLLAAFAAGLPAGTPVEKAILLLFLAGLLAAVLQFLYGALGGGRLIKFLPYPVVAGYLSGVGVLLFTGQVPKLLGSPRPADPSTWDGRGLAVGLATAAGMILGPRVTKRVPGVILGLAAGGLAMGVLAALDPSLRGLEGNPLVLGAVGAGAGDLAASFSGRFSAATSLTAADLEAVVMPAFWLSLLLSIDTLKTCVILDALTRSRHDSNRELRGQGLGNLASAVAGGMPGAGTMGATLVNLNSGGATRRSGVLAGAFALAALVLGAGFLPGLPDLVGWIPRAALSGIIMVVAARMVDLHALDLLRDRATILDFVVILAVVVTAVGVSLVAASGVGLALAILLFTREQLRGSVVRHRIPGDRVSSKRSRPPAHHAILQEKGSAMTLCALQGTLFFGTTDQLFTLLERDIRECRYLVLDLRRVQAVDYTAAHMLEQIEATLSERGAYLVLSNMPASLPSGQDLKAYFDTLGLVKGGRNVRVFADADDALEWVEDRILEEAGHGEDVSAPPLLLERFDLFQDLDPESLALLAGAVEERSLAAGETLFRRGDSGDEVFLIRRGRVEIQIPLEDGRTLRLASFSRQSFFGDLAFLDRGERSADAVAAKPTDLFALSRARFDALSLRRPETGAMVFARLARILAARLRQSDREIEALE